MPAANAITNSIAQNADRQIKYLTKSLVRTALKCPRKLAYATNPLIYPRDDKYINDPLRQYLSREGERFGEYCRSLFPHGVEISGSSSVSLEDIVSQTRHALMEGERQEERITLFEGAIRHGSFYVRPDIIDKISHTSGNKNQTELRLIEVKSKSWDSRDDLADKMSTNKGAIKATYLPYIQDIAFQTMTMREAYPELHISPWLMLPDRAKKMKDIDTSQNVIVGVPSVEDTMRIIDDSIATLINVDELVEKALVSEVQYPGSKKGETLTDVVHYWADQLNNGQNELDMLSSTPIGMHCGSCEYRPENISEEKYSGFDICWQNASGTEPDGFQKDALVIDLFGIAKKSLEPFISERKYKLTELSASDFELSGRKAANGEGAISTSKRQWLQVQTHKRRYERDKHAPPSYVMNKKCIEQEMKKWDYPLHFIDFETIGPVIPLYPGMSPYEVCAFQFSHHEMNENSNGVCEVKHATQFLHTEEGSPNIAFVKALCEAVGNISTDGGTVTMVSTIYASQGCFLQCHSLLTSLCLSGRHMKTQSCDHCLSHLEYWSRFHPKSCLLYPPFSVPGATQW